MIKSVAILDFETTGRDPVTCLVIEGAVASYAVMPDGTLGHPIDSYAELNDPSFPLPQEIIRLTGITDDMLKGRTLDSDVDNVRGRTTFDWLPGGFFLRQHIQLDFAGLQIDGIELIGYDQETGSFPSTVFSNLAGMPIPYQWKIDGDELTITTEMLGATFRGRWSEDGATFSGGWRPNPGREGGGNAPYDVAGSRAAVEK